MSAAAIAADGTWLATGGSDRAVRIWDTDTGRQRAELTGHAGGVSAVTIAPDGAWIATAGDDRAVRIWDSASGLAVAIMRVDAPALACTWSPCGRWIGVGSRAGAYNFGVKALVS